MRLEDLRPAKGAKKKKKTIGRGGGSGHGTSACKGGKGQKARAGGFHKLGFEGGQMPLQRRLPKFGFTNIFRKENETINLDKINTLPNTAVITPEVLFKAGMISKSGMDCVKVLGDGELKKAYTIKAHKFSKTALDKISNSGSKAEVLS
jgi:large subunit ribosomal protein L15